MHSSEGEWHHQACTGLKINQLINYHDAHCDTNVYTRVESGSDDPDNVGHLGHLFDGSSGSHLQTKLSGCDPDFLEHQVFVRIWQHLLSK